MVPKNIRIIEYRVSENKNKYLRKLINLFRRTIFKIKYNKKYDVSICYATYSIPGMVQADITSNNRSIWMHRRIFRYTSEVKKNIHNL